MGRTPSKRDRGSVISTSAKEDPRKGGRACKYALSLSLSTYMHTHTCTCTYAYTYTCTQTDTQTYTHTYTHILYIIYAHTNWQSFQVPARAGGQPWSPRRAGAAAGVRGPKRLGSIYMCINIYIYIYICIYREREM